MDLTGIDFVVVREHTDKRKVAKRDREATVQWGICRYIERFGVDPNVLAISPDCEYTSSKIEVVHSPHVKDHEFYFGRVQSEQRKQRSKLPR